MHKKLLNKGFEIELFTGSYTSHIGISSQIEELFTDFVKEPDNRNIEYVTEPNKNYEVLRKSLIKPRKKLREWLMNQNLTIIPSSTLCFEHDENIQRSDDLNPYHNYIETNYGIKIATSSVHINLGIDDLNQLFTAIRLARCEAALYLALSASSPFLNGKFTGNHSQRWIQFPKTPKQVPFFKDHQQYINWIKMNLEEGYMHNIRHFWSSIRPNGPRRPFGLDRLELRICDFISNIDLLIAITAFLELRTLFLFENPQETDPLLSSKFSLEELQNICDQNELQVSKNSLNAKLVHWKDGQKIACKEWIINLLDELSDISKRLNMCSKLQPIYSVIDNGNQSMKWIESYMEGASINEIMKFSINEMIKHEQ